MGKAYIDNNFNDLLFGFKEHLKVKNYSPNSITAYSGHLLQFIDYLKKEKIIDVRRVTKDVLKEYKLNLAHRSNGSSYKISTISMKIRSVKRFFEYLEDISHILINPAEYIKEPKKETRLPGNVLNKDEVTKIFDIPNLSQKTGIRDRTILEVFYSTGVRLDELLNLTIFDCDLQGGLLRVNKGKGAKDRVVPLGKHAVKFLKEYISNIRPKFTKRNKSIQILFLTRSGKKLSKQNVEKRIRNYAKQSGIKKRVTPHTFRHTFATELIRNGADIRAVQKMLGHSALRVTQIYTKVAGLEIKQTHTKHHPREKDRAVKKEITPNANKIKNHYRHE